MENLKLVIFIVIFINSVVNAYSQNLPEKNNGLVCHQMTLLSKSPEIYSKSLWYTFKHKNYSIHYEYKILDVYKSKSIAVYDIKNNNIIIKKLIVNDDIFHHYTSVNLCEGAKGDYYFVLEESNFESEGDNGENLTGKLIEIISDNNESINSKYFSAIFYDQYFKVPKKQTSQYKLFTGYTPEKVLKQDKYLPITYTMYKKNGGLYMKVGSTYKTDIITLKKPTSGK